MVLGFKFSVCAAIALACLCPLVNCDYEDDINTALDDLLTLQTEVIEFGERLDAVAVATTSASGVPDSTTSGAAATDSTASTAARADSTTSGVAATNSTTSAAAGTESTTSGVAATNSTTSAAEGADSTTSGAADTDSTTSAADTDNTTSSTGVGVFLPSRLVRSVLAAAVTYDLDDVHQTIIDTTLAVASIDLDTVNATDIATLESAINDMIQANDYLEADETRAVEYVDTYPDAFLTQKLLELTVATQVEKAQDIVDELDGGGNENTTTDMATTCRASTLLFVITISCAAFL